jgi:uncharacterized membrane protein YgaE (UPF0421/DUF939 family)
MGTLILIGVLISIIINLFYMEELKALILRISTGVDNIKADITRIKENLPATGGLTEAQVAELRTSLEDAAAKVESLDAEN